MTVDEAREAIRLGKRIRFKYDPEKWGYLSCMDDAESGTVYLKGLFRTPTTVDCIELDEP